MRMFHQMISRRPIAVTVEQCADNAAVQRASKSFVFLVRLPLSDYFVILRIAPDVQPFWICRAATEAGTVGSVFFLKRLVTHGGNWSCGRAVVLLPTR